MAVVAPVIFQIVGLQNSGKTTFIKKIIEELNKNGLTTVTMKHHGHGGKPLLPEEKDSHQHVQGGAIASLVEGEGRLILHAEKSEWSIGETLQLTEFFHPDIVLIEGYKKEDFPKAILIRRQEDVAPLSSLRNIKVAYYWDESLIENNERLSVLPKYSIHDRDGLAWLINWLLKEQSV